MAFVGISLVLVAVVLVVQTGSVFVMLTGIFESGVLSNRCIRLVWSISTKGITNLMFIGVVILGIGADDIFVTWMHGNKVLGRPSISEL